MMDREKKILVAYFSSTGNTAFVARTIAKACGADIAELVPKKQMNTTGMGYFTWGVRQLLREEEREIAPIAFRVEEYDLIIVGTPVWTFTLTPPVRTFLRENHFDGKNLAFFCCHGGDYRHTLDDMKAMVPGSHIEGTMEFLNALDHQEDVADRAEKWVKSLK